MKPFRKQDRETRECKRCKRKFVKENYNQAFCGRQCREDYHNEIKSAMLQWARENGPWKD